MNIYVVVEGNVTEKLVYASWIPLLNPQLTQALRLDDVDHNRYFIESGGGIPSYFDTILGAMENVVTNCPHGYPLFDRLVIAVDSEYLSLAEKRAEIQNFVDEECAKYGWVIDLRIIVQHFCFETWALANPNLIRGNIHDSTLKKYIHDYNVSRLDPELLPPRNEEELNRAQHAKKYLNMLFKAKFPKNAFSPTKPGPLTHEHYFRRIVDRQANTGHVDSFSQVLTAFV